MLLATNPHRRSLNARRLPHKSNSNRHHEKKKKFSGLRGVVGDGGGGNRGKHGLPKVGAPGSKMKRLHGLLAAAEEKKQRLEGLRQTEEGKEKAKQEGWADAIRVAGGAELKDNPAALKKMIKRREKDKAKSAAKWDDRLSSQRKEQSKRQDKREENLNRRKKGGAVAAEAGDAAATAGGEGGKVRSVFFVCGGRSRSGLQDTSSFFLVSGFCVVSPPLSCVWLVWWLSGAGFFRWRY